ncbi:MAG TPA: hypothetical protein VFQ61_28335 [Polyangiaceae bacterium]|nr:hypothetical protein [Polyangiaceae bacterium]
MTTRHQNDAHRSTPLGPATTKNQHAKEAKPRTEQRREAAYRGEANEEASKSPHAGQPDGRNYRDRDGNAGGSHAAASPPTGKTKLPSSHANGASDSRADSQGHESLSQESDARNRAARKDLRK